MTLGLVLFFSLGTIGIPLNSSSSVGAGSDSLSGSGSGDGSGDGSLLSSATAFFGGGCWCSSSEYCLDWECFRFFPFTPKGRVIASASNKFQFSKHCLHFLGFF